MKIAVKLFGRYKTMTGKEFLPLEIENGSTLQDIVDVFVKRYPDTEKDKKNMIVTRNKRFMSRDTQVTEHDEITIIPPVVSGG